MKFELTPEILQIFKESTDFDYVVTATARRIRDEVPGLVYPEKPVYYQKSESEVCIAVYDIADGARIYYQRVIASVTLDEGDEKVVFGRSAGALLHNAMGKALKDLKKNSKIIRKIRPVSYTHLDVYKRQGCFLDKGDVKIHFRVEHGYRESLVHNELTVD